MTEYTQGICEDGAAILKDGVMMTVDEIVAALNRFSAAEALILKAMTMTDSIESLMYSTGEDLRGYIEDMEECGE